MAFGKRGSARSEDVLDRAQCVEATPPPRPPTPRRFFWRNLIPETDNPWFLGGAAVVSLIIILPFARMLSEVNFSRAEFYVRYGVDAYNPEFASTLSGLSAGGRKMACDLGYLVALGNAGPSDAQRIRDNPEAVGLFRSMHDC